jgi:hypothetical protein
MLGARAYRVSVGGKLGSLPPVPVDDEAGSATSAMPVSLSNVTLNSLL